MSRLTSLLVCVSLALGGCVSSKRALVEEDLAHDEARVEEQDPLVEESEPRDEEREPRDDESEREEPERLESVSLPPCESHTECYLQAREAFDSGERAGYLLTVDRCEFYRGRYQLEQFYGLCLLMLGDAYRHLGRYEDAKASLTRFLSVAAGDVDLAMQARAEIEEIEIGEAEPALYAEYLSAISLLRRFNRSRDPRHAIEAQRKLEGLHSTRPDWALDESVRFLLGQIEALDLGGDPDEDRS